MATLTREQMDMSGLARDPLDPFHPQWGPGGAMHRVVNEARSGVDNTSGLIPVEFFVVVALDPVEEKTAGGIILPPTTQDKDKLATQEGTLIAVSPLAFNYDEWPADARKPAVGDRVLFKRYAGALHERDGRDYRLLNDKDIIAIVTA